MSWCIIVPKIMKIEPNSLILPRNVSISNKLRNHALYPGVAIRVDRSCSCRVNVQIVSIFVNRNPTRIINVSIFANSNSNSTYLLFALGSSTRI